MKERSIGEMCSFSLESRRSESSIDHTFGAAVLVSSVADSFWANSGQKAPFQTHIPQAQRNRTSAPTLMCTEFWLWRNKWTVHILALYIWKSESENVIQPLVQVLA